MDPQIMSPMAQFLVHMGLPGIVILALGWAYWRKDGQLVAESAARVGDAKAYAGFVEKSTKEFSEITNALKDVAEQLKDQLKDQRRGR